MPPKRKAKEVLPLQSDAAPGPQKRKVSDAHTREDDVVEIPAPRKPAKRVRNTQPQAKKAVKGDGDFVGYDPQKPATIEQHLRDQNNKSKQFLQEFKDEVSEGSGKALVALIKSKEDLDRVRTVEQDFPRLDQSSTLPNKAENALYQETQKVIHLCRRIHRLHKTAEEETQPEGLKPLRETWKKDEQGLKVLLRYGKQYGERMAENLLSAEERDVVIAKGRGVTDETEQSMQRLFEESRKAMAEKSWGSVVKAQMKAFSEVIKTLATKD
ncbi:hypothetical protein OQA88_12313 [Cercophora sp. LCS_1]